MRKQFTLFVTVILLFAVSGSAQSRRKRPNKAQAKVTNAKLPKELILQMVRDDEELKSSLQEQGGNIMKFSAENFSARVIDLNGDGKPEWFIDGLPPNFCGAAGRSCAAWIYREVAGKYELLLAGGAVPLSTFTNGYRDLEVGYGPWIPTIFTYDGKHYKEGYDFTIDQIIMPSKWDEIKKLVCRDSKKRLVRVKNNYLKNQGGGFLVRKRRV